MNRKRRELTDAQWAQLQPLLPPQRTGRRGRTPHDHRRIVEGILWLDRTGAQWRDLPERFGNWRTVASRFHRWRKARIWERALAVLHREADAARHLDWRLHFVDSTHVRAHQHAAGARRAKEFILSVNPPPAPAAG